MNSRQFPGLGLVLVAALAPAHATAQQRAVSLAEAIALAQKHDPNVVQAAGDVRSAGAETRARYGSFLPSVSAGAGGGKAGRNSNGSTPAPDNWSPPTTPPPRSISN